MSSAQQINCCMGLKHTTDSDTHLRRHRRHLPWFQRGVRAQSHMGMAGLLFYTTQVITGCGFRGSKGWAHTTSGTVSTLSFWKRLPGLAMCTLPSLAPAHLFPSLRRVWLWVMKTAEPNGAWQSSLEVELAQSQTSAEPAWHGAKSPRGMKRQQNQDERSSAQTKPQRHRVVKSSSAIWNRVPAELSRNRWHDEILIPWPGFQGVVHHCFSLSRS